MSAKDDKKEHSGFADSVIGANTIENIERYGRAASEYIKGYRGTVDAGGKIVKKGVINKKEKKDCRESLRKP